MAQKKLHFETLQLHVGQEQPDPATDAPKIVRARLPQFLLQVADLFPEHGSRLGVGTIVCFHV